MGRERRQVMEKRDNIRRAIENSDINQFDSLKDDLGELSLDQLGERWFAALLDRLLSQKDGWFGSRKKRQARAIMLHHLLTNLPKASILNIKNEAQLTPLHLAIMAGNGNVVNQMLNKGADITIKTDINQSTLELAAECKKNPIYKRLLKAHASQSKENPTGVYQVWEIERAQKIYVNNLKKKQIIRGLFASIMAIACPVGAILAFYELPLLEVFFSFLIPGVGPIIGLVGAALIGGILLWSMYEKSSMKYGHYAQEMVTLDGTNAQLDQLENELKKIQNDLSQPLSRAARAVQLRRQQEIITQLDAIYSKSANVEPRIEADSADWATGQDRFRAKMLTFGSFLCAFSGMLGVLSGLSGFLPAAVTTTAVLAGIPVAGWCALGVALLVGVVAAAVYYHLKYVPSLEQSGKAREAMHEKKVDLCARQKKYETYKQTLNREPVTGISIKEPNPQKLELSKNAYGTFAYIPKPSSHLVGTVGFYKKGQEPLSSAALSFEEGLPNTYKYGSATLE